MAGTHVAHCVAMAGLERWMEEPRVTHHTILRVGTLDPWRGQFSRYHVPGGNRNFSIGATRCDQATSSWWPPSTSV